MKFRYSEKKNSPMKKIIPAAAMLLLSTVMLSTSTFAWFTMNKEVQMTGLAMSATAGDSLEIALASVDSSGNISSATHPADTDEYGWKSTVNVGDYYSDIGKLKPASSVDGINFFYAKDAGNGGTTASVFESITLGAGSMAAATMKPSVSTSTITSDGTEGYYVDIPVYLRTNKVKPSAIETTGDIYCKIIINNPNSDNLYKAVRVAFIPSAGSATIFGIDKEYYNKNGDIGTAVNGAASRADVDVVTDFVSNSTFTSGAGVNSGLKILYAENAGEYGHLDFTVRVWLEGESTSCLDLNAGQNWKIDFAFSLGAFGA